MKDTIICYNNNEVKFMKELLKDIKDVLEKQKLVIFVGAGV